MLAISSAPPGAALTRRACALAGAALAIVLSAPGLAAAQAADQSPAATKPAAASGGSAARKAPAKGEAEVSEVVVTATGTNISDVKPVGSEAIAISREQITATGLPTIADVVKSLPQAQNLGFNELAISAAYGGNAGATQSARGANGGNTSRGSQINLRGLPGQNSTLLLVDGHRLAPSGVQAQFQEANQVPIAAVDRVEVIADGASAVYGSDAISGVVNFVLRKRYDGAEVSLRYGDGEYGGANFDGAFTFGHDWDKLWGLGAGNLIFSYSHFEQNPILRGNIPQLRADLRPFGGNDNRINGGASFGNGTPNIQGLYSNGNLATAGPTGNIVVSTPGTINQTIPIAQANTYYRLPNGLTGNAIPTAAQVLAGLNQPDLVDSSDYEDLQPEVKRDQFFLFARQEITDHVSVFYEGFMTERDTKTRIFYPGNSFNNEFQVNPGTPYYISGLTGPTDRPYFVQYDVRAHYPGGGDAFFNSTPETTYTHIAGVDFDLKGDWKGQASVTYGANKACGVCYIDNFFSNDTPIRLEAEVNAGRLNPYSRDPISQSELVRIVGSNIQRSRNTFWDSVLKLDGTVFQLPAGPVKVALGVEYTHTTSELRNGANRPCDQFVLGVSCTTPDNIFRWDANSHEEREQYSAFGELYLPIVGDDNAVALIQELTIDAAVRYDHYDAFGETTNPKIGVTWKPHRDLTVRGSWGTSFRAPGLPDTDPGAFSAATQLTLPNNSGDPNIPIDFVLGTTRFTTTVLLVGGNPDVGPERGETWSFGVDYQPEAVRGLKLSATYFNVQYKDRIGGPPAINYILFGGAANAYLQPFVIPTTTPAGCSNSNPATWNPLIKQYLSGDVYGPNTIGFLYNASSITNPCGIHAIIDQRTTNLALTKQDGVDLSAIYALTTDFGALNFGLNFTKIFNNESQPFEGQPTSNELDRVFFPVSKRGRASVGWFQGPWSANLFANYVGGFLNDQPITRYTTTGQVRDASSSVSAWTTFDANVNYVFQEKDNWALRDLRVSVNVNNLFNKSPPTVLTGTAAAVAATHSVLGRTASVTLTKRF